MTLAFYAGAGLSKRTTATTQPKGGQASALAPHTPPQWATERKTAVQAIPTAKRSPSHPIAQKIIGSTLGREMPDIAAKLACNPDINAADATDIMTASNPELVEALSAYVVM